MSTELLYPPGFKPGCLQRKSKCGEWCPMAAEHIKLIPSGEWDALAKQISLRPFVKTILDQDGAGSCATESTTGAVKIGRELAGLPFVELNPWFIYHTTSGGRDQGSSIDENLAFVRENGIAPISVWPRSKGWQAKPSAEAVEAAKQFRIVEFYEVASVEEMVSCLLTGFPVVYGANGHSVCKVQHLDATKGLDLNSWAASWGDGGFGVWAKYNQISWSYGAFAVRTTTESLAK